MSDSELFWSPGLVARFESAADAAAAVRMVGHLLVAAGAATEAHVEAAVTREERNPTGLPAREPFALVHTDAVGALRLAAGLGLFDEPVAFRRMDDPSTVVEVRAVVFLCVPERERQAELLSALIQALADGSTLREAEALPATAAYRLLAERTAVPAVR